MTTRYLQRPDSLIRPLRSIRFWGGGNRLGGSGGGGPDVGALIGNYTWTRAWDFRDAPATPGNVPAFAGSTPLSLDAGTYTIGASTGPDLTAGDIGTLNDAIATTTAEFSASVPARSGDFHLRSIFSLPDNASDNYLFVLGDPAGAWIGVRYRPSVNRIDLNVDDGAIIYISFASTASISPGDWVLMDVGTRADGANRSDLIAINNVIDEDARGGVSPPSTNTSLEVLHRAGGSNFDGAIRFIGYREAAFTGAEHTSDFNASGLAA